MPEQAIRRNEIERISRRGAGSPRCFIALVFPCPAFSIREGAGLFHSAWSHVEYALCQSIDTDDDLRLNYLSYAQELLGEIIKADISGEIYGQAISHPISQDQLLGALTLSSYVPVFRQRALGEVTQRRDCVELYESLGQAMSYLRPLDIDEPPQWRMAEMAMLALSARTTQPDFLLYPASPREERAPRGRGRLLRTDPWGGYLYSI